MSKLNNLHSILTTAALNAEMPSDDMTEEQIEAAKKTAVKRVFKRAAVTALLSTVAMTALVVIAKRLGEDEETEETENTDI